MKITIWVLLVSVLCTFSINACLEDLEKLVGAETMDLDPNGPTTTYLGAIKGSHGNLQYLIKLNDDASNWNSFPTKQYPDFTGNPPFIIDFLGEDLANFLGFTLNSERNLATVPGRNELNKGLEKLNQLISQYNQVNQSLSLPAKADIRYYSAQELHVSPDEFLRRSMDGEIPMSTLHDATIHSPSLLLSRHLVEYNAKITRLLLQFKDYFLQKNVSKNIQDYVLGIIQLREVFFDNGNATFANLLQRYANIHKPVDLNEIDELGYTIHFYGKPPTEVVIDLIHISINEFKNIQKGITPNQQMFTEADIGKIIKTIKLYGKFLRGDINKEQLYNGQSNATQEDFQIAAQVEFYFQQFLIDKGVNKQNAKPERYSAKDFAAELNKRRVFFNEVVRWAKENAFI